MSSSSLRWSSGPWWLCGGWAETPAVPGVRSALHAGTPGTDSSPYSSSWSQSSSPPGPESQELKWDEACWETDRHTDRPTYRHKGIEWHRWTYRHLHRQTYIYWWTDRHMNTKIHNVLYPNHISQCALYN